MSTPPSQGLRSVKVVVAGQTLALRSDASAAYLRELAAMVDARLAEVRERHAAAQTRPASTQALVLLCALQLADELHQRDAGDRALRQAVRERAERILRHLDDASEPPAPRPRRKRGERTGVSSWR